MKKINPGIIKLIVIVLTALASSFTFLSNPSVLTNEDEASKGNTNKQIELGVYYLQLKHSSNYRCLPSKGFTIICKALDSLVYNNEIQDTTSRGIYWLRQAEKKGDVKAKYLLAMALQNNNSIEESFQLFKQLVEIGHIESNYQLGWYYLRGVGVEVDYDRAIYYLSFAKDNNHPKAARLLEVAINESKS